MKKLIIETKDGRLYCIPYINKGFIYNTINYEAFRISRDTARFIIEEIKIHNLSMSPELSIHTRSGHGGTKDMSGWATLTEKNYKDRLKAYPRTAVEIWI